MTQRIIADFDAETGEILAEAEPINGEAIDDLLARVQVDHPSAFIADLPETYKNGWVKVNVEDNTLFSDDDAEVAGSLASHWAVVREERNTLLTESDWTQYNDSPLTDEVKTSWQTYRQALRDLPENTDDPANPTWPTPPG